MDYEVIKSYLVQIGFEAKQPEIRKMESVLGDMLHRVEDATSGLAKVFVGLGATVVGTFAGLAAGTVGLMTHVARTDQEFRLLGERMGMTTNQAKMMQRTLDAMGVTMADVFWDAEIGENFKKNVAAQQKMYASLGEHFHKNMKDLRDLDNLWKRFWGIDMPTLQEGVVASLANRLKKYPLFSWFSNFIDLVENNVGEAADKISDILEPVLVSVGEAIHALTKEALQFIGFLSDDESLKDGEVNVKNIGQAFKDIGIIAQNVVQEIIKIAHWLGVVAERLTPILNWLGAHPKLALALLGAVSGAMAGSMVAGPWGALAGAIAGLAGGTALGSSFADMQQEIEDQEQEAADKEQAAKESAKQAKEVLTIATDARGEVAAYLEEADSSLDEADKTWADVKEEHAAIRAAHAADREKKQKQKEDEKALEQAVKTQSEKDAAELRGEAQTVGKWGLRAMGIPVVDTGEKPTYEQWKRKNEYNAWEDTKAILKGAYARAKEVQAQRSKEVQGQPSTPGAPGSIGALAGYELFGGTDIGTLRRLGGETPTQIAQASGAVTGPTPPAGPLAGFTTGGSVLAAGQTGDAFEMATVGAGSMLGKLATGVGALSTAWSATEKWTKTKVAEAIAAMAKHFGVPPQIALAVAAQESRLNPDVKESKAGAVGVMQLMPKTAQSLGVNPYNTLDNIKGGVTYLANLFKEFGDWHTALMAYNWGPGAVEAWVKRGRTGRIPAETAGYTANIEPLAMNIGGINIYASPGMEPDDVADAVLTKINEHYNKRTQRNLTQTQGSYAG